MKNVPMPVVVGVIVVALAALIFSIQRYTAKPAASQVRAVPPAEAMQQLNSTAERRGLGGGSTGEYMQQHGR